MEATVQRHEELASAMEARMKAETNDYEAFKIERELVFYREQIWVAKNRGMTGFDHGTFLKQGGRKK